MSSQDISNPGSEQSIDVKETEKKSSESNRVPDGGWAWMVVFGSFMCNVVLDNILLYLCMICSFHGIGQILNTKFLFYCCFKFRNFGIHFSLLTEVQNVYQHYGIVKK
jgi:hypothetical protein